MKNLRTLVKDLQDYEKTFAKVVETALLLGAKPCGLNDTNALLTVLSAAERHAETEATVKALGYSSLAVALKALGQTTRRTRVELPASLKHAPSHHVVESWYDKKEVFKNGKLTDRVVLVRGVCARTAELRWKNGVLPNLEELWEVVENCDWADEDKKDYLDELVRRALTNSYEEFSTFVLSELNSYYTDDLDLEEEEENTQDRTQNLTSSDQEKLAEFRKQCEDDGVDYDEEAALLLLQLA